MPKDPNELGVLWEKVSGNGTRYMSGTINGERVVVFQNRDKKSDKHPDYRVLKSVPKPESSGSAF